MHRFFLAAILLVVGLPANSQDKYFPPKAFSDDVRLNQFVYDWYSSELKVLEEPSLFEMAGNRAAETYRFLWLRTFDHPVAVRLEFRNDGSAVISAKVATGSSGYPDKKAQLLENFSRPITRKQTQVFQMLLKKIDFWKLPSSDEHHGNDGADWIVEGVKQGTYHLVVRWSPKEGGIRELGEMLAFGLADLKIPKDRVY